MSLAKSAPKVGAATAERAPQTEAATANAARPSGAPLVDNAQAVEPSVTVDDPRAFAPKNVKLIQTAPAQPAIMSVVGLRGTSGANFESQAAVLRGAPEKTFLKVWLPFIFDERDFVAFGEVLRYVLVKGNCCFVFADDKSHAPIYAISLDEVRAVMEDPKNLDPTSVTISPAPGKVYVNDSKEHFVTVLLKSRKDGSQAYQFTFDTSNDRSLAKRFHDLIENSSIKQQGPVTAAVEPIVEGGIEVTAAGVTASALNANTIGALAATFQPDL